MKKILFKRFCSYIIVAAIIMSIGANAFATTQNNKEMSVNEILEYYQNKISFAKEKNTIVNNEKRNEINNIRDERDMALTEAGYGVYRVNAKTFEKVGKELNTDMNKIGLDREKSYLIVISAKDYDSDNTPKPISAQKGATYSYFNYSYNGISYKMRYMYVTADDEEASNDYLQMSSVDLIKSPTYLQAILNCLNTTISTYVSAVSSPLGIIYSLLGINISDIGYSSHSTLRFEGDSRWSRVFTQVWSSYDNAWTFGSSVECVEKITRIYGSVYNESTNSIEFKDSGYLIQHNYSDNYNNSTWRKSTAARNFYYSNPCSYDITGDVRYVYGNSTLITHREPVFY